MRNAGWLSIATVAAIGLFLRLYGITQSLWLDELSTWWCVQAGPREISSRVISFQGQSPLYYFLAWGSTAMVGQTEVALRVPSLLASLATAALCGLAAHLVAGPRSGWWAAALTWLTFAQVQSGVNARPYALAILGTSVMTLGYLAAVKDGAPWSRVLFVGGAALQFWAHFLLVLPIVGLVVAHLALSGLHGRYSRQAFSLDCLLVLAICLPAWPYFQASTARTQHITWLATPHHGDIMALLGPVVLPIAIDLITPSRDPRDARTIALMASVGGVILALESALLLHATVVSARYLEPIVVPAAILAGAALSRLSARDASMTVVAFLAINGSNAGRAFLATGTFSGLGVEDWRSASYAAREAVASYGATVILLRSGFAEESFPVPGHAPPAARAVLDVPGQAPIRADIVSLTYRWSEPARAEYFASVVAPRIVTAPALVVVAQHATDADGVYGDHVAAWIRDMFGTAFKPGRLIEVRGVDVLLFTRPASGGKPEAAPAPP